jgi:DNA polymerase III alpha subunit
MRALLARLKTDSYMGLTAASSVIRPGVAESGMMQEYIRRHNGLERKLPSHPVLDELLPETHGVMVYQEDVIRVAHEVAGFTPSQADILRRSMSGKMRSADAMNELREGFLEGCIRKGRVDAGSALEVWRQLSSFSGYSFCKAHSASFATLSYQVGWLKAHYPAELMAAVLSNGGGFYGVQAYLSECRRLGLAVLLPAVNASAYGYVAETPTAVRIGLCLIKGLSGELLQRIPAERERGGPYRDLVDFRRRIRPHRKELETLILCGALDCLGRTRPELLWEAGLLERTEPPGMPSNGSALLQAGHGSATTTALATARCALEDYSETRLLQLEAEHFGMVISRLPLEAYPSLPRRGVINAVDIARHAGYRVRLLGWCIATKRVNLDPNKRKGSPDPLALQAAEEPDDPDDPWQDDDEPENAAVEIGLLARPPGWKRKGESSWMHAGGTYAMKFMSMEDSTGTYEITLFPQAYAKYAPLTRFAGPFVVYGTVDDQFGVCTVTCDHLELLDVDVASQPPRIAY